MPLGWLGWAINSEITGVSSAWFHAGNVFFHATNTVLVFLIIQRLLRCNIQQADPQWASVMLASAVGAGVWAIHPLRVEVVAWSSARIYNQAFFFAFACVLSYLRFAQGAERRWVYLGLSCVFYAASLLTYPLALGFFAIPLLLDIYPLRRIKIEGAFSWWNETTGRVLAEKLPFVAMFAAALGLTLWARVNAAGIFDRPATLEQFSAVHRAMQAFYVWLYYVWKPLVPFGLAPHYTTLIDFHRWGLPFVFSVFGVIGISFIALWKARQWPAFAVSWLCHLILLVPMLGLTEIYHVAGDRYSYGVSILFSVWLAAGLLKIREHSRWVKPVYFTVLVVCAFLAVLTIRQLKVWKNSIALYSHTLRRVGDVRFSEYLHSRLADALYRDGRLNEALDHYSTALRLNPALPEANEGMANALSASKRIPEAIKYYRAALAANPNLPAALNNLAWILTTDGNPEIRNGVEAVQLAERACQLTGQRKPVMLGTLAAAYAEDGRFAEAVATAAKAQQVAVQMGESAVAERNRELMEMYRNRRAYHESADQ